MNNFNTLIDVFLSLSNVESRGITFISRNTQDHFISYKDIFVRALQVLNYLQSEGVQPGNECIFQIKDNENFLYIFWACILGSIMPVPVTVGMNDEHRLKVFRIWQQCTSPFLITDAHTLNSLENFGLQYHLEAEVNDIKKSYILIDSILQNKDKGEIIFAKPSDVAFVQFSSGSTSSPKGVVLTHRNLLVNINASSKGLKIGETDSMMSWLPLTHDMGLIGSHLTPSFCGINQYIISLQSFIMKPLIWLKAVSTYEVSIISSTNFGLSHVLDSLKEGDLEDINLSSVRIFPVGAEYISPLLLEKFSRKLKQCSFSSSSLFPVYGLAEATVAVAFPEPGKQIKKISIDRNFLKIGSEIRIIDSVKDMSISYVSVGNAVRDCAVRICDNNDCVVNENVIGHIQVKGENVTEKYYNDEVTTNATFTYDGWLRTGDTGFFRDNFLYIIGRVKDVVIFNGKNYYLNDIDRVVEGSPVVKKGHVASIYAFNAETENDELILFVVYRKNDLKEFLSMAHKIQDFFYAKIGLRFENIIPIKAIPFTTSGKLKRYKLTERYMSGEFESILIKLKNFESIDKNNNIDVPEISPVEMQIIENLQKLFRIESIHPENSFFELGGDSFKAVMLISSLNKLFGVRIKLDDLFFYSSIRQLAVFIENLKKFDYEEIPIAQNKPFYSLSPAQKRMFVLHQLQDKKNTAYNVLGALKITGITENKKIKDIFSRIIKRHEVLRTKFIYHDGVPVQVIQEEVDFQYFTFDVTEKKLEECINEMNKPFNFDIDNSLFRVGVVAISGEEYILLLCLHHIIADGTSMFLIMKEFVYFYRNLNLPLPEIQYKDYSEWFIDQLHYNQRILAQEKFWLGQFQDGIPALHLPTDFPRPLERTLNSNTIHFSLKKKILLELKTLAEKENATLFMVLLACFFILLYKYTAQEDIVIGTPVAGRSHISLHNAIGLFVNTICLRNKPQGEKKFTSFLSEVKYTVLDALENQEYQFEMLVDKLNIKRSLNMNPLFDIMFVMQKIEIDVFSIAGLKAKQVSIENNSSNFDITFQVFEKNESLEFAVNYSLQLFKKQSILKFIKHYNTIISSIINNPEMSIAKIEINSEKDKEIILQSFNASTVTIPENMIQLYFEEQVRETPDAIAVNSEDISLTYKELNDKANCVARLLIDNGIRANQNVGLMTGRSVEFIIGMLGIIKAGGAYVPIEIETPVKRINFILNDCKAVILLAQFNIWEKNKYDKIFLQKKIYLDDPVLYEKEVGNPVSINKPEDAAYVMYTSGTTGKPKGVVITHENILNLIWGLKEKVYNRYTEKLNICFVSSITFDMSVMQIFPSLVWGHSLFIMPDIIKKDGQRIIDYYVKNKIDISEATPTFLQFLLKGLILKNIFLPLKYLLIGGEALPKDSVKELIKYMNTGLSAIANVYGPTECCVISTFIEINKNTLTQYNTIPIGKPMPNEQIYILDKDKNPTPIGIPGELYIAGNGVGKEYLNRPDLTKERFVTDPFRKLKKMYKTGDLACWLPDGTIEFFGRIDKQVKVRGYRIEPEEIEIAIREHPGINDVVVIAKEFFPGDKRIVAYILTNFIIYWDDMLYFLERKASEKQTCRRSAFRAQYRAPCTLIKGTGKFYNTRTVDISYHGIALERDKIPATIDEEVTLSIMLPDLLGRNVKAIITYLTEKTINLFFHISIEEEDIIKKSVDNIAKELDLIVFDFRRSEYRIPIKGSCVIETDNGEIFEVGVRDLSHSGISLLSLPEMANTPGELNLKLSLEKSIQPIEIRGTIVWQTEKEIGVKFLDTRNNRIHMEFENHIQHRKLTVRDLRKFLKNRLPEYMIPSIFIIIDSIPLTKSGKIDLAKLPEPRLGNVRGSVYEPAVSDIENKLIKVWQDILGIEHIGITDNFFEIGGDSFKALQVALSLQSEYNIDINDLIKCQTISELVRKITPKEHKTKEFLYTLYEEYTRTLKQEKEKKQKNGNKLQYFLIDYEKKYKSIDLKKSKKYNSILLIGATGYLGSSLTSELLHETQSDLYLLIRAKNSEEAELRLLRTLNFYFGHEFYDQYKHRIHIINGDLSKDKLGLSESQYMELSGEIDCIFNSAAIVKHFGNVMEFLEVNVKGPERLLYFARETRKKDFFHISTMSVAAGETLNNKPLLFTEVNSDINHIFDNVYIRTKKESEKIVIDWRKQGLNTTVFRTGMLMFHSGTGQFQKNIDENAFYRFLGSLLRLGCSPDVMLRNLDFSFIDYVSRAIVLLATREHLENEVFHIFNPHKISLVDLTQKLQEIKVNINLLSFYDFIDFLIKNYNDNKMKTDIINVAYYLYIYVSMKSTNIILRSGKTEDLLKQTGFEWPKIEKDHIQKMILYARKVRYFK